MGRVEINPQRLDWCLKSFHMSPEDLYKKFSIKPKSDQRILLTVPQLKKIAEHFDTGLLFFLNPKAVEEDKFLSVQFRTLNSQKPDLSPDIKKLITRIEQQRELYLGLLEELAIPVKKPWKPSFSISDTEKIRRWLGLGEGTREFDEIRRTIEEKGIMVFETPGYRGKWSIDKKSPIRGFSLYYEELPVIVVKKQESKEAQTFTLLHELGHLLLHANSYIDDDQDLYSYREQEKEANEFSGKVLVPDDVLSEIKIPDNVEEFEDAFKDISKKYGVNVIVFVLRLLINGKISQETYNTYKAHRENRTTTKLVQESPNNVVRAYRYREPLHIFGHSFVRVVFSAYYEQHIPLSKVSTYLDNLKIPDLHKLEEHLVQL